MQAPERVLLSIEEEKDLQDIKNNGGFGLDQITGALAHLLKDNPTVYVTTGYFNAQSDDIILTQLTDLQEESEKNKEITFILIPYFLHQKHSILIVFDTKKSTLRIFNSQRRNNDNIENLPLLKYFFPNDPMYKKNIIITKGCGRQNFDWECGIYTITNGLCFTNDMAYPKLSATDLDTKLREYYNAWQTHTAANEPILEYQENNFQQKRKILDVIESIRDEMGFFKSKEVNPSDLLRLLANKLQVELWGNAARTDLENHGRKPNPNSEMLYRGINLFIQDFSKSHQTQDRAEKFCRYMLEQIKELDPARPKYDENLKIVISQLLKEEKFEAETPKSYQLSPMPEVLKEIEPGKIYVRPSTQGKNEIDYFIEGMDKDILGTITYVSRKAFNTFEALLPIESHIISSVTKVGHILNLSRIREELKKHIEFEQEGLINSPPSYEELDLTEVALSCQILKENLPLIKGMYFRLVLQLVEKLAVEEERQVVRETTKREIDLLTAKRLEMQAKQIAQQTVEIQKKLRIDEKYANFLAGKSFAASLLESADLKNFIKNYSESDLNEINQCYMDHYGEKNTIPAILRVFDQRNQISGARWLGCKEIRKKYRGLVSAVKAGDVDAVNKRIEDGINIYAIDPVSQKTLLHYAAEAGWSAMMHLLITHYGEKNKSDINLPDKNGSTPLVYAIKNAQLEMVEQLIEAGAEPSDAALRLAVVTGNIILVKAIINAYMDPNAFIIKNYTEESLQEICECYAAKKGEENIEAAISFVFDHRQQIRGAGTLGCKTIMQKYTELCEAIKAIDVESVKKLILSGINIYAFDLHCEVIPLQLAIRTNTCEMVALLLDKYSSHNRDGLNIRDINHLSLVHEATRLQNVAVLKLLLDAGANHAEKDNEGDTALHIAAQSGNTEIIKLLLKQPLQNKETVNPSNNHKATPLHKAITAGHSAIVELLIKAGANPLLADELGYNALHLAVKSGNITIVETVIKTKVFKINGEAHKRALDIALKRKDYDVAQLLILEGAQLDDINNLTGYFLHVMSEGITRVVKLAARSEIDTKAIPPHTIMLQISGESCTAYWQYQGKSFSKSHPQNTVTKNFFHEKNTETTDVKLIGEIAKQYGCSQRLENTTFTAEFDNSYVWIEKQKKLYYVKYGRPEIINIKNTALFQSVVKAKTGEKQFLTPHDIIRFIVNNSACTPTDYYLTNYDLFTHLYKSVEQGNHHLAMLLMEYCHMGRLFLTEEQKQLIYSTVVSAIKTSLFMESLKKFLIEYPEANYPIASVVLSGKVATNLDPVPLLYQAAKSNNESARKAQNELIALAQSKGSHQKAALVRLADKDIFFECYERLDSITVLHVLKLFLMDHSWNKDSQNIANALAQNLLARNSIEINTFLLTQVGWLNILANSHRDYLAKFARENKFSEGIYKSITAEVDNNPNTIRLYLQYFDFYLEDLLILLDSNEIMPKLKDNPDWKAFLKEEKIYCFLQENGLIEKTNNSGFFAPPITQAILAKMRNRHQQINTIRIQLDALIDLLSSEENPDAQEISALEDMRKELTDIHTPQTLREFLIKMEKSPSFCPREEASQNTHFLA